MSVNRLSGIPGFSIDKVAEAAGGDPEVLRLENLDTDIQAPEAALDATRNAIGKDKHNSYLPFIGQVPVRAEIALQLNGAYGTSYADNHVVLSCGGTEAMFNAILATTDPGDEVVLTDPTYAGMIYRVKLAGAVPRLVPFVVQDREWRLDIDSLSRAVNDKTRVVFIMNPSMPSGAVLDREEWGELVQLCKAQNLWLIYNAAMERLLYDGREVIHPLQFEGMEDRTIIIGSVSKEYRMIGWRLGWAVGPKPIIDDIARVSIYNAVTPTGIAQAGALAALQTPVADVQNFVAILEKRRNMVNAQLSDYDMVPAAGGWSQLVDVSGLGINAQVASDRLLEEGKIAATPMTHWGAVNSHQFIRLVFSNESIERLSTLRVRFSRAF